MPKLKKLQKLEIVAQYREASPNLITRKQKTNWLYETSQKYNVKIHAIGRLLDKNKIHTWRSLIKKVCPYRRSIAQVKGPLNKAKKKRVVIATAISDSNNNLVEAVMSNGIGAAIKEFAEAKVRFEQAKANLLAVVTKD